ncbi:PREDICTED: ovalbumin-related protein X-like [Gavialis gangeticus]|uniref:ovalbumin-related protein X-like n=1 Tax=Gavialis gangeticus TaxID=94835 RepID=UPI00092E3D9E|nr:PREDICTED: ovalbumin-related protein X-like [Gavialis gangeticus]
MAFMLQVFHFDDVLTTATPGTGRNSQDGSAECEAEGAHHQVQALLSAIYKPNSDYSLSIANRLYVEITSEFCKQYLSCTKTLYHAELEEVDFRNAPHKARIKINSWVENKTNGKIKELFPSDATDDRVVLVLVNAIYFKGKWALEFVKEKTKETAFRVNKNEIRSVQMMFLNSTFKLAIIKEPHLEVLELPYIDNELSMFILLPKDIGDNSTGLEQLESALTYEKLAEWISSANMNKQNVNVYLPRFKMEEDYNLKSSLQAMGVLDVFSFKKSDLTGMSKSAQLYVSRALHKSYVDVNEEGTEASTGTGVVISRKSAHDFKADHPFLFFIKHNATNSILFYGRCASPVN